MIEKINSNLEANNTPSSTCSVEDTDEELPFSMPPHHCFQFGSGSEAFPLGTEKKNSGLD
jgi:hypothetical protein